MIRHLKTLVVFTFCLNLLSFSLPAKHYRYISIDAGGMLGLIPALILEDLERNTNTPIYQLIDGMIGTSTGSIIATLLNVPTNGGVPDKAAEVVKLYKEEGNSIFKTIIKSYFSNSFRKWLGIDLDYAELDATFVEYSAKLWGNLSLYQAYNQLFVLSLDVDKSEAYVFSADHPRDYNLPVRMVVKASISIEEAFGSTAIKFPSGEIRRFIDAGSDANGRPSIIDPSYHLYLELQNSLSSEDTAVIYSLGTGFEKTSADTKRLMEKQRQGAPDRIKIIRLQPEIEKYAGGSCGSIWMTLFASDTSPRAIKALTGEANRLTKTYAYRSMLRDMKQAIQ